MKKNNSNAFNPAGSIHVLMRSALRVVTGQRGALLLSLIVGMVAVGLLGAGMIYFTTTSTYGELFANRQARAYYVAEAGGQYAIKLLNDNKTNTTYLPPDGTYKLGANGIDGEILMSSSDDTSDPDMPRVKVESTGIVHRGTWLEARKKITFKIPRSNPTAALDGTTDISFDGDTNYTLDNVWEVVVGDNKNVFFDDKTNSVLIKNEPEALIAISTAALDMCTARANSGGLLSYEVQMKINPIIEGNKGEYFAQGISFRYEQSAGISYGVSFFRAIQGTNQIPDWYTNKFGDSFKTNPPRNGQIYVVLWKKTSSSGMYELLHYALAGTYGLTYVDKGVTLLRPFSALLVNLKEECNDNIPQGGSCTGTRTNKIQLYVAAPENYAAGTINWNYMTGNQFSLVTWNNGSSTISDTSLTTQGYPPCPNEVAIHSFYDRPSSNDQYFSDFAMRGEGLGGSGGYQY